MVGAPLYRSSTRLSNHHLEKGLRVVSNHVVGVALGTVFPEIQPGAGFKTSDFDKNDS